MKKSASALIWVCQLFLYQSCVSYPGRSALVGISNHSTFMYLNRTCHLFQPLIVFNWFLSVALLNHGHDGDFVGGKGARRSCPATNDISIPAGSSSTSSRQCSASSSQFARPFEHGLIFSLKRGRMWIQLCDPDVLEIRWYVLFR
jgi:hypothetical protein